MLIRIINTPAAAVLRIIDGRRVSRNNPKLGRPPAIALIQGQLADILAAADYAEKSAAVEVDEVRGLCPQHMCMIAVWGDTAAVQEAVSVVKSNLAKEAL
ncbi:MAG: BMC domain-containing protein [Bacillota bacterium]